MSTQKREFRKVLADRCEISGKTPYLVSLSDIKFQDTFTSMLSSERSLETLKQGSFVKIKGNCQAMCDYSHPERMGPVEELNAWIHISDIYLQDETLVLETDDGRMFTTEQFQKEWARKLNGIRDVEFSQLVFDAQMERGEMLRTKTLAVLKHLDADLKRSRIPEIPFWSPQMRKVTNAIDSYIIANHLKRPDTGDRLPEGHIAGLKEAIEKELSTPVRKHRAEFVKAVLTQHHESNLPIIMATDIIATKSKMPIRLDQIQRDQTIDMITREKPMENPGKALETGHRNGLRILSLSKFDDGIVFITPEAIISTFDFSKQYIDYLRRNEPHQLIGISGAAKNQWLNELRIPKGEDVPLWMQLRQDGHYYKPMPAEKRYERADRLAEVDDRHRFYSSMIVKAMQEQKAIVGNQQIEHFFQIDEAGIRHPINKTDIEPGMFIEITQCDKIGPEYDLSDITHSQLYVDDIIVIDDQLTIVSPDYIFSERDFDMCYEIELARQQIESVNQLKSVPEREDEEITFEGIEF